MRKYQFPMLAVFVVLTAFLLPAFHPTVMQSPPSDLDRQPPAWGFFGHRKINRQAVFTLPPELIVFYKKYIDYITEHAVDPDKRRYATKHEAPRHYMDLDRYGKPPFENVPRRWTDALMQFTEYFIINEKKDTLPLLLAPVMERDSLVLLNPKLFKGDSLTVTRREFRQFFIKNILSQYYEDEWVINLDSLSRLLNVNRLNYRKAFAVDQFSGHGIVPYHLEAMLRRLTDAFMEKDLKKILRHSADFGHYIADAHVPLHTTENYNGQLTGQDGIHAFWESRLPELYAEDNYDFWVGRATLIDKPEDYFWNIVLESHALVDSVLGIEMALRQEFPPDRQLCNEMRGTTLVKTQCEEFAAAYSNRLAGMVEARMQASILSVGSAWFTAWVMAGKPDLRNLTGAPVVAQDSTDLELEKAVKAGTIQGRPHQQ